MSEEHKMTKKDKLVLGDYISGSIWRGFCSGIHWINYLFIKLK